MDDGIEGETVAPAGGQIGDLAAWITVGGFLGPAEQDFTEIGVILELLLLMLFDATGKRLGRVRE